MSWISFFGGACFGAIVGFMVAAIMAAGALADARMKAAIINRLPGQQGLEAVGSSGLEKSHA